MDVLGIAIQDITEDTEIFIDENGRAGYLNTGMIFMTSANIKAGALIMLNDEGKVQSYKEE